MRESPAQVRWHKPHTPGNPRRCWAWSARLPTRPSLAWPLGFPGWGLRRALQCRAPATGTSKGLPHPTRGSNRSVQTAARRLLQNVHRDALRSRRRRINRQAVGMTNIESNGAVTIPPTIGAAIPTARPRGDAEQLRALEERKLINMRSPIDERHQVERNSCVASENSRTRESTTDRSDAGRSDRQHQHRQEIKCESSSAGWRAAVAPRPA
jgi:hypothetical protein